MKGLPASCRVCNEATRSGAGDHSVLGALPSHAGSRAPCLCRKVLGGALGHALARLHVLSSALPLHESLRNCLGWVPSDWIGRSVTLGVRNLGFEFGLRCAVANTLAVLHFPNPCRCTVHALSGACTCLRATLAVAFRSVSGGCVATGILGGCVATGILGGCVATGL
eukprot:349754-Chlamydomonas_euryale.AAC.6